MQEELEEKLSNSIATARMLDWYVNCSDGGILMRSPNKMKRLIILRQGKVYVLFSAIDQHMIFSTIEELEKELLSLL